MKQRWLWLTAGTSLALGLLAVGYLCLTAPLGQAASAQVQLATADGTLEEASPVQKPDCWVVQTIDGEICVIENETVIPTGLSPSLLPSGDQQALQEGIEVTDREALAALLEDLGS